MHSGVRAVPSHRAAALFGALALATLAACGGGSSGPTGTATRRRPSPRRPRLRPRWRARRGVCSPTPPPLYGVKVKIHDDSGFRKILDSRPQVINVGSNPSYCEMAGFDNGPFCFSRQEGGDGSVNDQMFACDSMAVGQSEETGRWGPTWYYNGKPCAAIGDTTVGCKNHPDNQFLVIAKGPGEYAACANPSVPIVGDRCGTFVVNWPASQGDLGGEPERGHRRDRRPVDRLVDAHADLGPALAGPEEGLQGHDRGEDGQRPAAASPRGRPAGTTAPPAPARAARRRAAARCCSR